MIYKELKCQDFEKYCAENNVKPNYIALPIDEETIFNEQNRLLDNPYYYNVELAVYDDEGYFYDTYDIEDNEVYNKEAFDEFKHRTGVEANFNYYEYEDDSQAYNYLPETKVILKLYKDRHYLTYHHDKLLYITPEGEIEENTLLEANPVLEADYQKLIFFKHEYNDTILGFDYHDCLEVLIETKLSQPFNFQGKWYGITEEGKLITAEKGWGELEIYDKLFA